MKQLKKLQIFIVFIALLCCITGCSQKVSITGIWYVTEIDGKKINNTEKQLYLKINDDKTYVLSMGEDSDSKYYGTWSSSTSSSNNEVYSFIDDGMTDVAGISSGTASIQNDSLIYSFTSLNYTFTLKK